MQNELSHGGYVDIPTTINVTEKLQKKILKSKKYKKLIDAGYVPNFSLKDDYSAIEIKPATCANRHPLFNQTHLCLVTECEGSMTLEEFNRRNKSNVPGLETVQFTGANTVTVYNVDTVPLQRYCKDHSGLVVDEDGVFQYIEECDCE